MCLSGNDFSDNMNTTSKWKDHSLVSVKQIINHVASILCYSYGAINSVNGVIKLCLCRTKLPFDF